jgi:hypothetical protein
MFRSILLASVLSAPGGFNIQGELIVATYAVDYATTAGNATLGPTAPGWVSNDSAGGLGFDPAGGETIFIDREIPDCWDGVSDLTLKVYWFVTHGDAIQNGETVIWDYDWRSVVWGTEDVDQGTVESDTDTYTEAADPGDDDDTHISTMTLVYNAGNQTIAAGDTLIGALTRDAADTYSGEAIFKHAEVTVNQTSVKCDHL